MQKISCIVPVYNEGPRIANVLQVVSHHSQITEIIVVDDASNDNTNEVVQRFPDVKLINHTRNLGKTQALISGIMAAGGELLFFLDADLIGLTAQDISDLIEPVISKQADISISLRKNSPWLDRIIGVDIFSGERLIPKELIERCLPQIAKLPRFGFESFLNKLIIKNKLKIKIVFWKNVISPWKYQKGDWWQGIRGDVKMIKDILKTISVWEIIYQFFKLRSLNVK